MRLTLLTDSPGVSITLQLIWKNCASSAHSNSGFWSYTVWDKGSYDSDIFHLYWVIMVESQHKHQIKDHILYSLTTTLASKAPFTPGINMRKLIRSQSNNTWPREKPGVNTPKMHCDRINQTTFWGGQEQFLTIFDEAVCWCIFIVFFFILLSQCKKKTTGFIEPYPMIYSLFWLSINVSSNRLH